MTVRWSTRTFALVKGLNASRFERSDKRRYDVFAFISL